MRWRRLLLRLLDFLFNCLILAPLSMLWWAGTWRLFDKYLFPSNHEYSVWICTLVGLVGSVAAFFVLPPLGKIIKPGCNFNHVLVSRLFNYVHGVVLVALWRGAWEIPDEYWGEEVGNGAFIMGVCWALLLLLRCSCFNVASPFIVVLDDRDDFYTTLPRFKSQMSNLSEYLADAILSMLVIHTSSVLVWRGIWILCDYYLPPTPEGDTIDINSYLISLYIGYGSALLIFLLNHPIHLASQALYKHHRCLAVIFDDFVNILATISTVMVWRGGVGAMDDFVIGDREHEPWMWHGIGGVGLMLLNASSNYSQVGVAIDCDEGFGIDIIWPIEYFSTYLKGKPCCRKCTCCKKKEESKHIFEETGFDTCSFNNYGGLYISQATSADDVDMEFEA